MRKIESEMLAAIAAGRNWRSGNTAVKHDPVIGGVEVEVTLHGNLIAKRYFRGENSLGCWEFTLAGWNTVTTRSRLSALIRSLTSYCCGVGTKRGQTEVRYVTGTVKPVSAAAGEWFTV